MDYETAETDRQIGGDAGEKTKEEHRVYLGESLVRHVRDDDLDKDDEEENVIDEEAMENEWNENE